ncbi:tetratricopeptide repeat protein [Teredinibacter franksiae]|uniref:tetratricopeptide repeat protein n=1 Tax=Teredinibacter franksiae TaxID=2761453 RepID=UPI001624D53E|nr:tetratricopeptide repeat protein [Teredinibacter franksiae]
MEFTNPKRLSVLRYLLVVLVATLFAACGGAPKKDQQQEEQTIEKAEGDVATEPPLELIPNPYLDNKPSVPGRAKDEFAEAADIMDAKQWKEAEGLLVLMTETYPLLSGPHVNLAICLYQQELLEQAEASFSKAIEVNPANMDAYTWLGVLYREQGKFTESEATYKAALAVWPHHADSHRNLGILYDLYMGRLEEALAHYKLLQRILPDEDRQLKGWIRDLERRLPAKEE